MKYYIATAFAALLIGTATTPSVAEDQPSANSSSHTMGDSGTLPPTGTVSGRVPDMGAGTGTSSGSPSDNGSSHTMGDEGKLPATNSMSGAVPKMTSPDSSKK